MKCWPISEWALHNKAKNEDVALRKGHHLDDGELDFWQNDFWCDHIKGVTLRKTSWMCRDYML